MFVFTCCLLLAAAHRYQAIQWIPPLNTVNWSLIQIYFDVVLTHWALLSPIPASPISRLI